MPCDSTIFFRTSAAYARQAIYIRDVDTITANTRTAAPTVFESHMQELHTSLLHLCVPPGHETSAHVERSSSATYANDLVMGEHRVHSYCDIVLDFSVIKHVVAPSLQGLCKQESNHC